MDCPIFETTSEDGDHVSAESEKTKQHVWYFSVHQHVIWLMKHRSDNLSSGALYADYKQAIGMIKQIIPYFLQLWMVLC